MPFESSLLARTFPRCSITKYLEVFFLNVVKFKVNIVFSSLTLGSQWANGTFLLAMRKKVRERNSGRECVCSCSLVCVVQNWFKAPGHRKKAALHSRHVPETSSRGSTIAIQQRRLQTLKWVCSVLQCPTWQSATYSTSRTLNMPPPPCCHFSTLSSSSSFSVSASISLSVSHIHLQSYRISLLHAHAFLVRPCILSSCHLLFTFTDHHCPATMVWLQ